MDKNWEEIKKLAGEYAEDNLQNGYNCAESVLLALIRSGAIDVPEETVSYATCFGGGCGGVGYTCGALTSAVLANNIVHGRLKPEPGEAGRLEMRAKYYPRANNIVSAFVKEAGSGLCSEIINQFKDGYFDEQTRGNCIRVCGVAARIAVDYLQIDTDEASKLKYDESIIRINNWME